MSNIKKQMKKNKIALLLYRYMRMILTIISPTLSTKIIFRISKGKKLNLKNPETLDEKISWLKLNTYYKNPLVSKCADKYAVRDYVKSCGCEEILNEIYGVFENVDDIPWDNLPNKFVLKWNMGCGCNIICEDKNNLNIKNTVLKLRKWKKIKYHLSYAEMQYKYIPRKITCERFLETPNGFLPEDYKIYCFNGEPMFVMVCIGREKGHPKFYYFDRDWTMLKLSQDSIDASSDFYFPKPKGITEMFDYARRLAKPFPFVRADFFLINGKTIFGELTFTPSGGIDSGRLYETNKLFGKLVNLNYKN